MTEPPNTDIKGIRIVVLSGSDAISGVVSDHTRKISMAGNNDSWRLIPDDLSWSRCHIGPSYFRQHGRWNFSHCSVIFNLISDPDYSPKTLRVAERITADFRDRLINDPRQVRATRRDDVSRTLQGVPWLQVPKVMRLRNPTLARLRARIEAEGFRFPAIVRRPGTQTGRIVGVFRRPEDMADLFARMKGEYYFTEFVDFRWSDALYRKMRLFSVGGEMIFDHMFISDSWNIHAGMARSGIMTDRADLRDEERRYFEGRAGAIMDHAAEMMGEVTRRLKLDYFGVDCSPTEDGGFILFEANAIMNIATRSTDPRFEYAQTVSVARAAQALRRLLLRRAVPLHQA